MLLISILPKMFEMAGVSDYALISKKLGFVDIIIHTDIQILSSLQ